MTKEERDKQIYDWHTDIDSGSKFRVFKRGIRWHDYLLPEERKFYESLDDIDQLNIAISCDPINHINSLMEYENSLSSWGRVINFFKRILQ